MNVDVGARTTDFWAGFPTPFLSLILDLIFKTATGSLLASQKHAETQVLVYDRELLSNPPTTVPLQKKKSARTTHLYQKCRKTSPKIGLRCRYGSDIRTPKRRLCLHGPGAFGPPACVHAGASLPSSLRGQVDCPSAAFPAQLPFSAAHDCWAPVLPPLLPALPAAGVPILAAAVCVVLCRATSAACARLAALLDGDFSAASATSWFPCAVRSIVDFSRSLACLVSLQSHYILPSLYDDAC